ncbi:hypothetical protein PshuTeo1_20950 [Pseudomonas hunanensis]|nr:hypothetical protein PshuTeo1_20950 [Pseudomonas hunanensis]
MKDSRSAYLKLRDRDSYQFALASSAVILVMDGQRITDARIALGGVGTKPWRALEAERVLIGQKADLSLFTRVGEQAMQGAKPYEHNAFKIPLGQQVVTRNLRDLSA